VGKTEIDGDPTEAFGGIDALFRYEKRRKQWRRRRAYRHLHHHLRSDFSVTFALLHILKKCNWSEEICTMFEWTCWRWFRQLVWNSSCRWQSTFAVPDQLEWTDRNSQLNECTSSTPSTIYYCSNYHSYSHSQVFEAQAWLVAEFDCPEDGSYLLQTSGLHTFQIDDITLMGNIYNRNDVQNVVHLSKGKHLFKSRIR
jgi:hypothetical protein